MRTNAWSTPFGVAVIVCGLCALVLGVAAGAGLFSVTSSAEDSNLNIEAPAVETQLPDENALIRANAEQPYHSEPVAQPVVPPVVPSASIPEIRPAAKESGDDQTAMDDYAVNSGGGDN